MKSVHVAQAVESLYFLIVSARDQFKKVLPGPCQVSQQSSFILIKKNTQKRGKEILPFPNPQNNNTCGIMNDGC